MPRKSIGVVMLTGITLAGALGGQMMRSASRLPHRAARATVWAQPRPALPPRLPAAAPTGRYAPARVDGARDVFALAGD